jgi:DNA-binding IclR family transcriptional regulator
MLRVLAYMLEKADKIAPWRIDDFRHLGIPVSSLYRHLNHLRRFNMIVKVPGGYVLSSLILNAGTKQKSAFMRVDITVNQESIHGKA